MTEPDLRNLTKSLHEALVLIALGQGPRHGYQLALDVAERSEGMFRFKHGTLYPILHRLEKSGLIQGTWSDEGPRGRRKSYRLTRKGERRAGELRQGWSRFLERFGRMIREEEP